MIRYVENKYGKENVGQIITFANMGAKSAIRSAASSLGFDYETGDKLAKMIPDELGISLDDSLKVNPVLKTEYDKNEISKYILDTARAFEGLPTSVGTHAAGVVISPHPLLGNLPMWMNRPSTGKHSLVTQMDMNLLEKLGYLKMDFLGLSALTVIGDTIKAVKENHGVEIDYQWLIEGGADADPAAYELIARGDTEGVFQLEGAGMTRTAIDMKVSSFKEVTALVSLYRPGPMDFIPTYVANKKDPSKIRVPFKELEPILSETYGVLTYQEQVMRMVQDIAGYGMPQADGMRKAIGKKIESMIMEHRKLFVEGVDAKGQKIIDGGTAKYAKTQLEEYYDQTIVPFGRYAFNKSHAASYARIAIIDAYLKAHYPVEFMAASIKSMFNKGMEKKKLANMKNRYFGYLKKNNIPLLHPDVNTSQAEFYATKHGEISYGLRDIKDVGAAAEILVNERSSNGPYKDAADFFNRAYLTRGVTRKTVEALIKVGALSCLGIKRSEAMAAHDDFASVIKRRKSRKNPDSLPFLGNEAIPDLKEFSIEVVLRVEKKFAGTYLSGHPLEAYKSAMNATNTHRLERTERAEVEDDAVAEALEDRRLSQFSGQRYEGIVLVTGISEVLTKKKRDLMAFLDLDDTTGTCRAVIFHKTYMKFKEVLESGMILHIRGWMDYYNGEVSIQPDMLKPYRKEEMLPPVYVRVKTNQLSELYREVLRTPGKHPVIMDTGTFKQPTNKDFWVSTTGAQKLIEKYNGYLD